ncbi:hypothetical protein P691DRAFT_785131 [Macrolepiota fuliginosa MF-IS2]|uniref:MYND-type domain-containing protein n=1 Tax=Macrolepiota fuliginosa MF-IS2 TaxID=1400762 RepID=A0A9P5X624_9AGAR|nr:hypothetical protein P691DRAFT_785131 [Macrolepiota fuliginosa MF-IS2]
MTRAKAVRPRIFYAEFLSLPHSTSAALALKRPTSGFALVVERYTLSKCFHVGIYPITPQRVYCSSECQREDWKLHKQDCRRSVRIELKQYWPFIALLAECCRLDHRTHPDMALKRTILNDPTQPTTGSDRTYHLVEIGEVIPEQCEGPHPWWWPSAPSQNSREKLWNRIRRERFSVEINLIICISLLKEMYTSFPISSNYINTLKGPESDLVFGHRIRLKYGNCPITDFGFYIGTLEHSRGDRLAYEYEGKMQGMSHEGANPANHSWMYFMTSQGEEIILDFGMYFFNDPHIVTNTADYLSPQFNGYLTSHLPFIAGDLQDSKSHLREPKPRKRTVRYRFSMLLHQEVRKAAEVPYGKGVSMTVVFEMLEGCLGSELLPKHKQLMVDWIESISMLLKDNLIFKRWEKYPSEPVVKLDILPSLGDDATRFTSTEIKFWDENVKRLFEDRCPGQEVTVEEVQQLYLEWKRLPAALRSEHWNWERDKSY